MAVKHWNTGASAERYRRENEQASKQKNKFKKCGREQARKKGGQYPYQLQSKVVRKPPPI